MIVRTTVKSIQDIMRQDVGVDAMRSASASSRGCSSSRSSTIKIRSWN